jgi:hypothetical protein
MERVLEIFKSVVSQVELEKAHESTPRFIGLKYEQFIVIFVKLRALLAPSELTLFKSKSQSPAYAPIKNRRTRRGKAVFEDWAGKSP